MRGLLVNCKHVHLSHMYVKYTFVIIPSVTWEWTYYKFIEKETDSLTWILLWHDGVDGGWRAWRKLWGFGDKVLKWNSPQINRVDTCSLGTSNPQPSKSFLTQQSVAYTHAQEHCKHIHTQNVFLRCSPTLPQTLVLHSMHPLIEKYLRFETTFSGALTQYNVKYSLLNVQQSQLMFEIKYSWDY